MATIDHFRLDQLDELTFVVLDTETTGKFPDVDRVIEVGAIKCRVVTTGPEGGETGLQPEIIETYEQLIDPEIPLPPDSVAIHGIQSEMLIGKPKFRDIAETLDQFLGEGILVAHNASFDIDFLEAEFRRAEIVPNFRHVMDTLKLSREVWPHIDNYKLGTLTKLLKMSKGGFHRALQDTEYCMHLFMACLHHFKQKDPNLTIKDLNLIGTSKSLTFGVPPAERVNQMALF